MSRLGIDYNTFLDLCPIELYLALKDDTKLREYDSRIISESIRYSTLHLMNIQLEGPKKINNEKKLWSFEWEEKFAKPQTKKEMIAVMKTMAGVTRSKKPKK